MTIDTGFSTTSTNPVQNKVITEALGTKAPVSSLEAVQQALTAAELLLTSAADFSNLIATMKAELQAYVDTCIAEADWMDRATIWSICDDEIASRISRHNVDVQAHADIRALIEGCVTLATFSSHTSGGYDPVTGKNTSLHVTSEDRINWDAAALAIDEHLDEVYSASIHLAAGDRERWNGAATAIITHIADGTIHVTEALKSTWSAAASGFTSHIADVVTGNEAPHVAYGDRTAWNKAAQDVAAHIADMVLQTSPHLRTGERAAWNAAMQAQSQHAANLGIHVGTSDKERWDEAAAAIVRHMATVTGNPHGVTAANVGAYTTAEADSKIETEKAVLQANAQAAIQALLAGSVRYVDAVETLAELYELDAAHGDAYIVTRDPSLVYWDKDGNEVYQSCVYVCTIAGDGSVSWVAFSAPFTVDLSEFATDDEVADAVAEAVRAHDRDATAHEAAISAFIDEIRADVESIRETVEGYAESKLDKTTFEAHANDFNNPHHVTAEDVGTLTGEEIEDAIGEAEQRVIDAATEKINEMVVSTLKWKSTIDSFDELVAMSSLPTAWRKGADRPDGETFTPDYGFCYTVSGTAQMFVYLGVPEDLDPETWAPETDGTAANYAALCALALADTAEVQVVTTVPNAQALVSLAQEGMAVSGGRYAVLGGSVYRFTAVPTVRPETTDPLDWGWVAVDTDYTLAKGARYWVSGLRKVFTFNGRPRTAPTSGTTLADAQALGWTETGLTTEELLEWGWDDVGNVFNTSEVLNRALAAAQELLNAHNLSGDAHPAIQSAINEFTQMRVHFPGDGDDDATADGYWTVGVNAILNKAVSVYSGLATTRQIVALTALVDRLYAEYANKQCKLIAGDAIVLNQLNADQEPVEEGEDAAFTEIKWDAYSVLKKKLDEYGNPVLGDDGRPAIDESYGLTFKDGELYSTFHKKLVTKEDGSTEFHVVLGEAYATLKWLTDYVAGIATWTNIEAELAKKQDLLTEGPGIDIRTVVDADHEETYVNAAGETITVTVADRTHLEISTVPEEEQSLELTLLRLYGDDGKWYDLRVNENGDLTTTEVI